MYNLRKVFTLIFFAIQMGVFEYSLFEMLQNTPTNGPFNGGIPYPDAWTALMVVSGVGTFIWFLLVLFVGGSDYQGKGGMFS